MHVINQHFKSVFLISHPGSTRHKRFLENWPDLNFTQARFVNQNIDCMPMDGLAKHNFDNIRQDIPLKDQLSRGQVAVALAHMLIYDEIIKQNLTDVLIFEDDSVFIGLQNLEEVMKINCDILSLFAGFMDGSSISEHVDDNSKYTEKWDRQGTSAYVIRNPSTAKYLLEKQSILMDTADGVICTPNLKVIALWPPACTHNGSPSILVNGLY